MGIPRPPALSGRGGLEVCLLVLVAVPLWLLTRDLFAGSAAAFAEQTGHWDGLREQLRAGNAFHAIVFYEVVLHLGQWTGLGYLFWSRVVATLLVLGVFVEQARIAERVLGFDPAAARALSFAATLTPFWYTLASSDITAIALWWWLMLSGWRRASDLRASTGGRMAGFAMLTLSFTWPSMIVFALVLQACQWQREPAARRQHLQFALGLLLAAVCVYLLVRWVVPPSGYFAGTYNNILVLSTQSADWLRVARAVAMFGTWLVVPALASTIGLAWLSFARLRKQQRVDHSAAAVPKGTALRAVFLLVAAALAYVVVGKGPPLFTPTLYGQGITEQLIRATHGGWMAPTWANTSQRHAVLLGLPIATLSWAVLAGLVSRFGRAWSAPSVHLLCCTTAVAFLVWLMPSYHSKLTHQAAELSLIGGLRAVQPPPPGFVSLRYGPVADWLIGPGDSNMMLRDAWGTSEHYSLFHAIDAAEREQQWIFHAYIKAQGGTAGGPVAHFNAFAGPLREDCMSRFEATLPFIPWWRIWLAGWGVTPVPSADVKLLSTDCVSGRSLPNPLPDKRIIP